MASRKLLLRAARLIKAEAELHRESCKIGNLEWQCEGCGDVLTCKTRKHYLKLLETVKALRHAA